MVAAFVAVDQAMLPLASSRILPEALQSLRSAAVRPSLEHKQQAAPMPGSWSAGTGELVLSGLAGCTVAFSASRRRRSCATRAQRQAVGLNEAIGGRPAGPLPLDVGVGTCLVPNEGPLFGLLGVGARQQIEMALGCGYRMVDTAWRYGNEQGIGEALSKALSDKQVRREELFVVSKLWVDFMTSKGATDSVEESLRDLKLDVLDLYLIHWPGTINKKGDRTPKQRRMETWKALEAAVEAGKIKNIGVANFCERHLEEVLEYAKIPPAVNQFEIHPYNARWDLVDFCHSRGIQTMAYSPLGGRDANGPGTGFTDELLLDPVIKAIAAKKGKTSAQVCLRWALQRGITPIPKASSRERLAENRGALEFQLSDEDMRAIGALDRKEFVIYDTEQMP